MNSVVSARLWLMSKICTFSISIAALVPIRTTFISSMHLNKPSAFYLSFFFRIYIFFLYFEEIPVRVLIEVKVLLLFTAKGTIFWYVAFISIAHHSNAASQFSRYFFFFLSLFLSCFFFTLFVRDLYSFLCSCAFSLLTAHLDWIGSLIEAHTFLIVFIQIFSFSFQIYFQKFGCNLAINSGPQIKKFKKTKQTIKIISSFLQFSLFFFSFYFHHKMFFFPQNWDECSFKMCLCITFILAYDMISMHRSEMKDQFKQGTI